MQMSSVLKPSLKRAGSAAVLCVAVLGLTGTACSGGSGDKDSKDTAASNSGKSDEDKAVEHRKCLRDHGLKVPEPKGGSDKQGGISIGADDKATMEKAIKACRDKAPKGMGNGTASQADKDKMVKYAACMRKNGVDVPMPKGDGGAARAMPMPKGEAEKKKHEKAGKACKGELQ